MAWIVLRGPDGIRRVQEGVPYRKLPGEKVVGSQMDDTEAEVQGTLIEMNMGLGDFVEKAIKLIPEPFRPKHCSSCEKRKQVMNRVRELGVVETFKRLREIE